MSSTWLRRSADLASTAWHIAFVDGLDGSSCVHEPELPADVQLRSSAHPSAPTVRYVMLQHGHGLQFASLHVTSLQTGNGFAA